MEGLKGEKLEILNSMTSYWQRFVAIQEVDKNSKLFAEAKLDDIKSIAKSKRNIF